MAFELPAGAALIYDSKAWHRGGANRSRKPRPVFYVSILQEGRGQPPAGLPFTMEPAEVACFLLTREEGVTLSPTEPAAKRGRCASLED